MSKLVKNFITSFLIITLSFSTIGITVNALTPEEELEEIQKQLAELSEQKDNINDQIAAEKNIQNSLEAELYNLKNQIDLLSNKISKAELEIKQMKIEIKLLKAEIEKVLNEISLSEVEISDKQQEVDTIFLEMYLGQKTFTNMDLVFSSDATSIVKQGLYQYSIQQELDRLVTDLEQRKIELDQKKQKLAKDKASIERDKTQIEEQKIDLEKDKTALDSQQDIYFQKRNDSIARLDNQEDLLNLITEEEKMALAEQQRLEQIIFDSIKQIPTGTFVSAGTIIGQQGLTGYTTGYHLHFAVKQNGGYINPCNVLKPNSICSGSSQLEWPQKGTYYLTSGYGWRWGKMHYGLDLANVVQNAPIYAAHSGYLYYGFEPCSGSICKNGGANYAIICQNGNNCDSGFKSLYWHLK